MKRILTLAAVPLIFAACSDAPTSPDDLDPVPQEAGTFLVVGADANATLYASQDIAVGEVVVERTSPTTVEVTYFMDPGYCLSETHWDVVDDISELINNGGNPQIGQFRYGDDMLDCVSQYGPEEGTFDANEDNFYVAAHAVVLGYEAAEPLPVVYGTRDVPPGGEEEGDIYGIDPVTGAVTLIVNVDDDPAANPFSPNGLAIDRSTETLYFVSDQGDGTSTLYSVPADGSAAPTSVKTGLTGDIYNATVDGAYYYYVPNRTDDLYRLPVDGSADAAMFCDVFGATERELLFGDIGAVPDDGTIYGVARDANSREIVFFEVDLTTCATNYVVPTTYDFLLQVAFGDDGTLYGQQAVSADAADPGRWYILDTDSASPTYGEITSVLGQSEISFTDIAGGLPVEREFNFEETAWADGLAFSDLGDTPGRGSWATYMCFSTE